MSPPIERSNKGRSKFGSKEENTDAAHILSFEVLNYILRNKKGRGFSEENNEDLKRMLNANKNLRIKTRKGNRSTDRRLDSKIMSGFQGKRLTKAAGARANRQYAVLLEIRPNGDWLNYFVGVAKQMYASLQYLDGTSVIYYEPSEEEVEGDF
eukprot:gb/GECH01001288.1/.p1 GENE.gb/GECH01001288.1/~~gb/GECH01001288.1/.p1  ORF type:complete len:153 (+),score=9.76 gb/GECH01001288.1/:1-459(+)